MALPTSSVNIYFIITQEFSNKYKAPEKQRPDGAAGAFGIGDTGV